MLVDVDVSDEAVLAELATDDLIDELVGRLEIKEGWKSLSADHHKKLRLCGVQIPKDATQEELSLDYTRKMDVVRENLNRVSYLDLCEFFDTYIGR